MPFLLSISRILDIACKQFDSELNLETLVDTLLPEEFSTIKNNKYTIYPHKV